MAVLERFGARLFVERLRLEWRAGDPIPGDTGRLSFRAIDDPGELIDLMTLVLEGTLDAHSRDDLARMTAHESAKEQYDDLLASEGGLRGLWRIATTPAGEPAGFVLPVQNGYHAVIGYIAVLPAQRGHGYIDEVLGQATRLLAAQDVPRIRAATDLGNVPMARAFARAGYRTFERKIDMTWL
jgi:RimJ/RimL family protein N-acetyltransferase